MKRYRSAIPASLAIALALALAGFGQNRPAAPVKIEPGVHPFEAPPRLKATGAPPAAAMKLMTIAGQEPCDEQGEAQRDGNLVAVKLDLVLGRFKINNPSNPGGADDEVLLRSYGGCKAGPQIEARPGDTIRFDLVNKLAATPDPTCEIHGPGCFNSTNLHTHGLHVSPAGNGDNVLLSIAPQTDFPYIINIPADHPSGTFWYHTHRHGATALQVGSGEAGLLVVRGNRPYTGPTRERPHPVPGDIDTVLKDAKGGPMTEKSFLFQQIAYGCFVPHPKNPYQQIYTTKGLYDANSPSGNDSPKSAPWICPKNDPAKPSTPGMVENFDLQLNSPTIWDTSGRFTSVNGVVEPTIGAGATPDDRIEAGEIQRWRFVHAGIHDTINLQIVRATTDSGAHNLVATSALRGNRHEQVAEVRNECRATEDTLIPQFEIAADGLTRTKIHELSGKSEPGSVGSNYLQAGYRSDVLVVFPTDGNYCMINQAAPASERENGGQGPGEVQLLAYIRVRGWKPVAGPLREYVEKALYQRNGQLPASARDKLRAGDLTPWAPFTELAAPVSKDGTAIPPQLANFFLGTLTAARPGPNNPVVFKINRDPSGQHPDEGKPYDPDVVNVTRQVNTTDDWLLTAGPVPGTTIKAEPHIFHIHVNPFEVMDVTKEVNGKQVSIFNDKGACREDLEPKGENGLVNQYCNLYHVFKDTLFVQNGYQVHIRTHYEGYIGEFVIHCHILDHEDSGMMWNVSIVPDLSAPGGGLGMGGMKHPK